MPDPHIPAACLEDARRVLAEQDPDASQLAERWPARQWRAALKVVQDEQEAEAGL